LTTCAQDEIEHLILSDEKTGEQLNENALASRLDERRRDAEAVAADLRSQLAALLTPVAGHAMQRWRS
jgi:hypothetical protein